MLSIKTGNVKASIEIIDLKLCDDDYCHYMFDVLLSCADFSFRTNFSEMYLLLLKRGDTILDENIQEKHLIIDKEEIRLEILSNPDELSDFEMKYCVRLDKERIDDFLIEFNAVLEVLGEEGLERYKTFQKGR